MHPSILDYLSRQKAQGIRDKTLANYKTVLRLFEQWYRENTGHALDPAQTLPIDGLQFRRELVRRYRPVTARRYLIILKSYFQWLVEAGRITVSPLANLSPIKRDAHSPRWLSNKEQYRYLRCVLKEGNRRDIAIIHLFCFTGIRVEELVNLRLADVNMNGERGKILIREGDDGWRIVPLNRAAHQAISRYVETLHSSAVWLFPSSQSRRLSSRTVQYLVRKYADLAEIKAVTPQTLRHTFCRELAVHGVPANVVATLAGYQTVDGLPNLSSTAVYYTSEEADLYIPCWIK